MYHIAHSCHTYSLSLVHGYLIVLCLKIALLLDYSLESCLCLEIPGYYTFAYVNSNNIFGVGFDIVIHPLAHGSSPISNVTYDTTR